MRAILIRIIRPAIILYALKASAALLIMLPLMVFLNGKFSLSRIADNFWPVPGHLALVEFIWQSRELLYIILPLVFVGALFYFVAIQFFSGGIYSYFLKRESELSTSCYFQACGIYFKGFLKIALVSVPIFIVIFLAADLVGLFFGKIAGIIGGKTFGAVIMVLFIVMSSYLFIAYLIVLRYTQIGSGSASLTLAFKSSSSIYKSKLRYFLALNILLGVLTIAILSGCIYVFSFVYKFNFSVPVLIAAILGQQIIILLASFLEALQISLNARLFEEKEADYGTEMG